jgi:hypothetical protein
VLELDRVYWFVNNFELRQSRGADGLVDQTAEHKALYCPGELSSHTKYHKHNKYNNQQSINEFE